MWRAVLSNNDVVEQNANVGHWRKHVLERCKGEGLHLTSLTWDGEEIDTRGCTCFIISDVFGTAGTGIQRARIGLGTFRSNGKGRIQWKTQIGDPKNGDYVEVIKPDKAAMYKELAVERKIDENKKTNVPTG